MAKRRRITPKLGDWLLVDWLDASFYQELEPNDVDIDLAPCKTAGKIIVLDAGKIALTAMEWTYCDGSKGHKRAMVIPRSCITRIRRLR